MANANASVSLKVNGLLWGNDPSGGPFWNSGFDIALQWANGAAAGQVNDVLIMERTVATGANDDINLVGTITNALGETVNAAHLVGFVLINRKRIDDGTVNTTSLTVGGGANAVIAASPVAVPPGGVQMQVSSGGIAAITGGSADTFRVTNSAGASNTYTIALLLR